MIARSIILATSLASAAALSQFPEFSQQYVQRLGGAVDALEQVVVDFDNSAAAEGLTRDQALGQMTGNGFVERRRADMQSAFLRHARLKSQLETLTQAGPFMRAYYASAIDSEVARAALAVYRPAIPLNFAGAIFACAGLVLGWVGASIFVGLFRRPRRGRV